MSGLKRVEVGVVDGSQEAPSGAQLAELRRRAEELGETFVYPSTVEEAEAELSRLAGRGRGSYAERHMDEVAVRRGMARRGGSAAVREWEVGGWGSSARWI